MHTSVWPLFLSAGVFLLVLGGVLWMHDYSMWPCLCGAGLTLFALSGWFRDLLAEHTNEGQSAYMFILFLISEAMLFAGLLWAIFDVQFFPSVVASVHNYHWFFPWQLPAIGTILLLLSSTTATWSYDCFLKNDIFSTLKSLSITIGLGVIFLCIQIHEYTALPFSLRDHIYASHFILITAFHGVHVLLGVLFLGVNFLRIYRGYMRPHERFSFTASIWYWHFVDSVWVVVFVVVYWIGPSALS